MKPRKVYELFKLCEKGEYRELKRFLSLKSNTEKHTTTDTLLASLIHLAGKEFSDKDIWKHAFPEKPYEEKALNRICHVLGQEIENYLAYKAFLADDKAKNLFLLKGLNSRKAEHVFTKAYNRAMQIVNKAKLKGEFHYKYEFDLALAYRNYQLRTRSKEPLAIQSMLKAFVSYIKHQYVTLLLASQTDQNAFGRLLPGILDAHLEENRLAEPQDLFLSLKLSVYRLLNATAEEEDVTSYFYVLNGESIAGSFEDIQDLYLAVLNFYAVKINQDADSPYSEQMFQFITWGIEHKLVFVGKNLPPDLFKNMIRICVITGRKEVIATFMEDLSPALAKEYKQAATILGRVSYFFLVQEWSSLLTFVQQRDTLNPFFEWQFRTYEIQAIYELNKDKLYIANDHLKNRMNNFRRYMSKTKHISKRHEKSFQTFFNYVKKILRTSNPQALRLLRLEISEVYNSFNGRWLIQKIDEKLVS
ncbi:MAG: hypothetical protein AAF824_09170 [Bacteroidota bacterium]